MLNLYNPLSYSKEQKIVYIKMLMYLAKSDMNPLIIEKEFIKKIIKRFKLSVDDVKNIEIPAKEDDLYDVLKPIKKRAEALDLIHFLWFTASFDNNIADDEIKIIRNTAEILHIDEDTVLAINNFVLDEIAFLHKACEILETNEVLC